MSSFGSPTMTRAWLTVGLLWLVAVLNNLDRIMLTTMRLSIKEAIPMTEAQFGLLTSVFLWSYAALNPLAGFLADRFNRGRVIMTGLFAWSLFTWLTGHAKTYDQLVVVRMFMGISEACFLPAALALIADYHGNATRSLATGIVITGLAIGSSLGGLGGWLAERQGWTYAFTLFGWIGMGYAAVLVFTLRDAPTPRDATPAAAETPKVDLREALVSLLRNSSFRLLLLCWGLIGIPGWAVMGWMPTYLNERFHLTQGEAGFTATSYPQVAGLIGLLIAGAWADRWSRTNGRARVLVSVIGLCLAGLGAFTAASAGSLPMAIAGLIFFGFTRVFIDANMMPILCMVSDPRYRATAFGIMNLLSCLVGGATIYAGGALRDAQVDLSQMFLFAAGSLMACAITVFLVKPQTPVVTETA